MTPHFAVFRTETKKLSLGRATREDFRESEGCQRYIRSWLDLDSDVSTSLCIEAQSPPESMKRPLTRDPCACGIYQYPALKIYRFRDPPHSISQPSTSLWRIRRRHYSECKFSEGGRGITLLHSVNLAMGTFGSLTAFVNFHAPRNNVNDSASGRIPFPAQNDIIRAIYQIG